MTSMFQSFGKMIERSKEVLDRVNFDQLSLDQLQQSDADFASLLQGPQDDDVSNALEELDEYADSINADIEVGDFAITSSSAHSPTARAPEKSRSLPSRQSSLRPPGGSSLSKSATSNDQSKDDESGKTSQTSFEKMDSDEIAPKVVGWQSVLSDEEKAALAKHKKCVSQPGGLQVWSSVGRVTGIGLAEFIPYASQYASVFICSFVDVSFKFLAIPYAVASTYWLTLCLTLYASSQLVGISTARPGGSMRSMYQKKSVLMALSTCFAFLGVIFCWIAHVRELSSVYAAGCCVVSSSLSSYSACLEQMLREDLCVDDRPQFHHSQISKVEWAGAVSGLVIISSRMMAGTVHEPYAIYVFLIPTAACLSYFLRKEEQPSPAESSNTEGSRMDRVQIRLSCLIVFFWAVGAAIFPFIVRHKVLGDTDNLPSVTLFVAVYVASGCGSVFGYLMEDKIARRKDLMRITLASAVISYAVVGMSATTGITMLFALILGFSVGSIAIVSSRIRCNLLQQYPQEERFLSEAMNMHQVGGSILGTILFGLCVTMKQEWLSLFLIVFIAGAGLLCCERLHSGQIT